MVFEVLGMRPGNFWVADTVVILGHGLRRAIQRKTDYGAANGKVICFSVLINEDESLRR